MHPDPSRHHVVADANEAMEQNLTSHEPAILTSYGLVGAILLFGGAGYLLDRWLETAPWFLVAGFATGILVGFFRLYRLVRRS